MSPPVCVRLPLPLVLTQRIAQLVPPCLLSWGWVVGVVIRRAWSLSGHTGRGVPLRLDLVVVGPPSASDGAVPDVGLWVKLGQLEYAIVGVVRIKLFSGPKHVQHA